LRTKLKAPWKRSPIEVEVASKMSSKLVRFVFVVSLTVLITSALVLGGRSYFEPRRVFAGSGEAEKSPAQPANLRAGQLTERELTPAEEHAYQIDLETGEYLHILVQQIGVNLSLRLAAPDGRIVAQLEGREREQTPVSVIADGAGPYRLQIRSLERDQTRGRYRLKVADIRSATAKDNQTVAAEKAFAEGEQLLREWKAESSRRAIERFRASLSFWKEARERGEEAHTLKRIGDVYQRFSESKDALASYNQALVLWRVLGESRQEADTLNEIGYVHLNRGENQQAQKLCSEALRLSQATESLYGKARALNNLGEVSYGLGRLQESLESYQKALVLWRELGDRQGQGLALLNSAFTYSDIGQMRAALDYCNQALTLWISVGDQRGQSMTLTAIGRLYSRMGESQTALNYFEQAMRLIEPIGAPAEKGRILTGLADVYNQLGKRQEAFEYYNQALTLFRATGDYSGEVATIYDAASVLYSQGKNQKALDYYEQALAISRAANDRREQAFAVRQIGRVYASLGDEPKALAYYMQSLSFWRTEKDFRAEADTLNPIAHILELRGETRKAREYYGRALSLSRQAEYRMGEAATLYNLARLERDSGNLTEARTITQSASDVIESLRSKVASQELRASYFASVREHFELYIDVLMQLDHSRPGEGFAATAFEISEKARARSLLESLQESRADIREGVDAALLERERSLQQTLDEKAVRRGQVGGSKSDAAEAEALSREIDRLSILYEDVRSQIKSSSPRYAALTQPEPLSVTGVQQRLLDDNTLLLEYMLGEERSYVWAVTRTEVSSYELPGRAQIEAAARGLYDLLAAQQPKLGETAEQLLARVHGAQTQLPSQIATLSKLLLAPVADKLGTRRLLIVPDGALQYIPFQALTVPNRTGPSNSVASAASDEQVPLVVNHEIVNEPSASALALVLSESANRRPSSKSVAILADPVFDAADSRIKSGNTSSLQAAATASPTGEVTRALRDVGVNDAEIPRLISSREEADAIMSVVPWRTGFKAVDFDASRTTAMGANLGQYRVVHFATHALLDNEHPELSGIVLSLVDQKGQRQDGFLRLHDIYNLKLPVDLVVLSACQTGLGKDVKGEGLIGLTRGFMYAGASGVVASLWKVDDEATAELMKHFYEGLFEKGMSPAAALREAQLALRAQKRWQESYYWAGFVIQGQYNHTVTLGYRSRAWQLAGLVLFGIILAFGTTLVVRKRMQIRR
jgi:CHAT domain-containing protein/tetratricopeptide (TPR) repeat protein